MNDNKKPDRKLIGIDGKWYDVTNWIHIHPGSDVINQFVGKDATGVFRAMHEKDVLKHWKPVVGEYEVGGSDAKVAKAFAKLTEDLRAKGFFKPNYFWFAQKFAAIALLAVIAFTLLHHDAENWLKLILAGVCLAFSFHFSGFLAHDLMHSEMTHEPTVDRWVAMFLGTIVVGFSSHWWRDEHFHHHSLPNTIDFKTRYWDPQYKEEYWAQHKTLFPLFKRMVHWILIKIQHLTFLPITLLLGRLFFTVRSMSMEHRWYEWVGFAIHCSWLIALLSTLPTWKHIFVFYLVVSVLQGVLHLQLLISHYSKDWNMLENVSERDSWYRVMVLSNINITGPVWFDWFHSGLNFHIEHHLFPRMPRNRLREAGGHVKKLCKELNLPYDECGFFETIWRTLVHMKETATLFTLDPN